MRFKFLTSAALLAFVLCVTQASAQKAPMKVTVATGGDSLVYLAQIVAVEKKYFAEEGLNVEFITVPSSAEAAAAVVGGSADFADGIHYVFRSQLRGQDIVMVANEMNQVAHMMVVSKKVLAKTGAKRGDPLDSVIRSLKGLKIGITSPGSSTELVTRVLFSRYGMNVERDATLVPLGNGGAMLAALETDQVDGFLFTSPFAETAVARGFADILVNFPAGDVRELAGYINVGYFTSRKVATERADAVQAFVNAIYKGQLYVHNYPDKAAEIAKKVFKTIDPKVLELAVRNTIPAIPENPITTRSQVEVAFNFLKYTPEERAKLPFEKTIDNRFALKALETISGVPE